eukprot:TRINITY_DN142204_c0_g1_i1.p1 TRINITY_DN142204_c0_g1~~TRINITY_DN142204_c0_g1_i1.p1  ORF type:complete len:179 (+),score=12.89 TRINITY_DN142204_c0_g1_i1:2-538(+)
MSAIQWVADFAKRVVQLAEISVQTDFGRSQLWLGGLFYPEAYFTASRQSVAAMNEWPLEDLVLSFQIGEETLDSQSFLLTGLSMQGASWDYKNKCLALTNTLTTDLPRTRARWERRPEASVQKLQQTSQGGSAFVNVPIYLTDVRKELVVSVPLSIPSDVSHDIWIQRACALIVWRNT